MDRRGDLDAGDLDLGEAAAGVRGAALHRLGVVLPRDPVAGERLAAGAGGGEALGRCGDGVHVGFLSLVAVCSTTIIAGQHPGDKVR